MAYLTSGPEAWFQQISNTGRLNRWLQLRESGLPGRVLPSGRVSAFFQDLRLPPIFSQVPLVTYFQDTGSLSTVL
jgi:hypothetical protein